MNLTDEQRLIIEETISNEDGQYACCAVAGSGKSFTIFQAIDYIKQHQPNAKILYVVFNKANQESANRKLHKYYDLPGRTEARTAHSYALGKWTCCIGSFTPITKLEKDIIYNIVNEKPYKYKNDVKFAKHAVFHFLHDKFISSKLILDTFCEDMELKFDDDYEKDDRAKDCTIIGKGGMQKHVFGLQVSPYAVCTKDCIAAFKDIIKEHERQKKYTHGMYLKYAAYAKTKAKDEWDYVFFDEAQDSNYFMLKLLDKQNIHKLYFIGDERQSIYNFGGANENVFKTRQFNKVYKLSKSFRFGDRVANLANKIIHMHSEQTCYGTPQTHSTDLNSYARLYRTNAGLFKDALKLAYVAKQQNVKLNIDFMKNQEGDDSYKYTELLSFLGLYYKYTNSSYWRLNIEVWPKYLPDSLKAFGEALQQNPNFLDVYNDFYDALSDDIHMIFGYAKEETNFVEKYKALQECLDRPNYERKVTMLTMHRSKGLEWDIVDIAEPTRLYYTDKEGIHRRNSDYMSELNLAYVAVTRARKRLHANALQPELTNESQIFENTEFDIDLDKKFEEDKVLQEA